MSGNVAPAQGMVRLGFLIAAKGRGFLVAVIAVMCLLLSDWLTGVYFHNREFYAQHGWPKLAAFWAAALIIWRLGLKTEETIPGSGVPPHKRLVLTERDTLFYVPARHWPWILCGLGVVFLFVRG